MPGPEFRSFQPGPPTPVKNQQGWHGLPLFDLSSKTCEQTPFHFCFAFSFLSAFWPAFPVAFDFAAVVSFAVPVAVLLSEMCSNCGGLQVKYQQDVPILTQTNNIEEKKERKKTLGKSMFTFVYIFSRCGSELQLDLRVSLGHLLSRSGGCYGFGDPTKWCHCSFVVFGMSDF